MEKPQVPMMYIYHVYGGEIVMDRAESPEHLDQAYSKDDQYARKYVAGSYNQIPEEELARMAKSRGLSLNASPRKALPPYVLTAQQVARQAVSRPWGRLARNQKDAAARQEAAGKKH